MNGLMLFFWAMTISPSLIFVSGLDLWASVFEILAQSLKFLSKEPRNFGVSLLIKKVLDEYKILWYMV